MDAAQLVALIERANREYWDEASPTLPDTLYDRLVETLRRLDPSAAVLDELGPRAPTEPALEEDAALRIPPGERLGRPVAHRRAMLSLDKAYTTADVTAWAAKIQGELLVMPKMDGLACSLRYASDGTLGLAATRGSGTVGDDITLNVARIVDVPRKVSETLAGLEVRGEVYMPLSAFAAFKQRYDGEKRAFTSPRNTAAGLVRQKDADDTRIGHLRFFAYDVDGRAFEHEREKLAILAEAGFTPHPDDVRIVERDDVDAAIATIAERRPSLDFEIDGVVLRAARTAERVRLGETGHHPRWSLAFKFQGDEGETHLRDIEWSVSRSGRITPVALLEPVSLSGAEIRRASLHNLTQFKRHGFTRGARVLVSRRGGVIPMVERVIEAGPNAEPFLVPTACPACAGPVIVTQDREAEFLQCVAPETCSVARLGALEHFAKVVDLQGFGPKVIAQAFDKGLLREPADYYRLTAADLTDLDRLGSKSAANLIDTVNAHREIPLAVFLQSLGIEHLGPQSAALVAGELGSLTAVRGASAERIAAIHGFSELTSRAIVDGLAREAARIDGLLEHVSVQDASATPVAATSGRLEGRSYLFTGALESFTRDEAEAKVRAHGGVVASGVSKTLNVLVIGRGKGKPSSKETKARALVAAGAPLQIVTEDEFLAEIGEA